MNEAELKRMIEHRYNSVRAFAIENNIPYTTMRSILERGILNAKADTIFKICKILNIRPEEIDGVSLPSTPKTAQKPSDLRLVRLTDNYTKLDDKRRDRLVVTSDELVDEMAASVE